MAKELRIDELPALRRPVLIAAFRGWNDGGQAATLAAGTLARAWDAKRFAEIDPEGFVDFQATRPLVSLAATIWTLTVAIAYSLHRPAAPLVSADRR